MAQSVQANLQQALFNLSQLLVLVTQVIASPTQAAVDAVVAAANTAGVLAPKPTYSLDGESYDWAGYQTMLIGQQRELMRAIQLAGGPFTVVSRARS